MTNSLGTFCLTCTGFVLYMKIWGHFLHKIILLYVLVKRGLSILHVRMFNNSDIPLGLRFLWVLCLLGVILSESFLAVVLETPMTFFYMIRRCLGVQWSLSHTFDAGFWSCWDKFILSVELNSMFIWPLLWDWTLHMEDPAGHHFPRIIYLVFIHRKFSQKSGNRNTFIYWNVMRWTSW